jgi:hypothetical protein
MFEAGLILVGADSPMLSGKSLRLAMPLLVANAACALLPCAPPAHSQDPQSQQTQSVADAARRAREEKKNAAKSSKVITDDDLKKLPKSGPDAVNVAAPSDAQPASTAPAGAAEGSDQTAAPTGKGSAKKAGEDPELARLKAQVAQTKKQLDLLQRELALDQDTFYSNADYAHDTAGRAKLATEQQQIDDKQLELDGLKTRLADLIEIENRKKKSASDDGSTPAPAQPQR